MPVPSLVAAAQSALYGPWDAAVILLREGLEALLVVAALLTILQRSGNQQRQRWVWLGAAAGLLLSVVLAVTLRVVLTQFSNDDDLIEGVTGVSAAVMLLYVGFWLHRKVSLGAWQRSLKSHTGIALERGSVLSLSLVSFLAVFREGAEGLLLYAGIVPSIRTSDLLLGLLVGGGLLLALAVAVFILGLRLPLRPLFLIGGALVYLLAFKFLGTGLHGLQVARVLPATRAPDWLQVAILGIFPTWETVLPQLVLLVLIATASTVVLRQRRPTPRLS